MTGLAWIFFGAFCVATVMAVLFALAGLRLTAELHLAEHRIKDQNLEYAREIRALTERLRPYLSPKEQGYE